MAKRTVRWFTCARCGARVPDYLAFGVGGGGGPSARHYCLHHVPWWVRVQMWVREVVGRG